MISSVIELWSSSMADSELSTLRIKARFLKVFRGKGGRTE